MKKCKECGREEWGFLSVLNEDGYCPHCTTVHYEEKIKKLQEQLKEANELLKSLPPIDNWKQDAEVLDYLTRWGVK